jgi:protein tyrosine phosphatase
VRPLVLPFEETRTLRNIPDFYLGANDVITPEQEYIVTEAPKPPTLERFWNAIMITDVRTIVALALPKNGSIKRPAYWKSPYLPLTTTNGQWTIRCGKEERVAKSAIFPKQVITRRVLSAFRGGVWRNITHLHYENWPDNGPPAADLFYKLLQLVEESQPKEHHKILVHCIAGIGRSGTFVAAHSIMKELNVNPLAPINIPKRIVELRLQRPRLVASESQIQSIYTLVQQLAPQYTTKSGSRHTQHRIHKKHHRR